MTILKYLTLLLTILILPGCSDTVIIAKDKLCQDWRIVKVSKNDTKETQKQVVGNNEARNPWCR